VKTAAANKLSPPQVKKLSSSYLSSEKKKDLWEIVDVEVTGMVLEARVRMRSHYVSPSDPGGFHLTQVCTLEFLSQLMIIFVHVLAGYPEKTQEGWMIDSHIACKRAVRDPENIMVRMEAISMRKVKKSILISVKAEVTDEKNKGLFKASLKGLLS